MSTIIKFHSPERKVTRKGRLWFGVFLIVGVLVVMSGCRKNKVTESQAEDILVVVNDSALRLQDVIIRIPIGLTPEDSTRLFHAIVNSWIDDRLLESVAVENIDDMDRIESLVSDYRRKLIVEAYKRKVYQTTPVKVSEDSLKRYYRAHEDEMRLESPLLKGIYIKIPENSSKCSDIRRWISSAKPDDIDAIEKYGLEEAVQYDYFADKWIEFGSIAEQIPYRFYDSDAFLASSKNFETTYNGFSYFLHISEYINSGETMPYDYGRMIIAERLGNEQLVAYEKRLLNEIRNDARKGGNLKTPGYDLVNRTVTLGKRKEQSK